MKISQDRSRQPWGKRRVLVPAVAVACAVSVASAAWACVPSNPDRQTRIASCSVPAGATKPCKTPIGAPTFPNATLVKGPSGSSIVAFVNGPGMATAAYDLVYIGKPDLAAGQSCGVATVKIGGPVTTTNGGITSTSGTIPLDSPLGLGQVCFTDVLRRNTTNTTSTPAGFKVTV